MKISIRVKANAKEYRVEKINEREFFVRVKEPPKEDKANKAVVGLLSDYFGIPKSKITIVSGMKSKQKVVELG